MMHKYDFEKETFEEDYTKEFGDIYDQIAQKTVAKLSMSKVLVHC
jgi:hypothetical protein